MPRVTNPPLHETVASGCFWIKSSTGTEPEPPAARRQQLNFLHILRAPERSHNVWGIWISLKAYHGSLWFPPRWTMFDASPSEKRHCIAGSRSPCREQRQQRDGFLVAVMMGWGASRRSQILRWLSYQRKGRVYELCFYRVVSKEPEFRTLPGSQ